MQANSIRLLALITGLFCTIASYSNSCKQHNKNKTININYDTSMDEKEIMKQESLVSTNTSMEPKKTLESAPVTKKVLDNGLTVLVRQVKTIPKVSVYLWYNVGSKDETDKERGIAHLIEHMIFKGTETLTESDINFVTHMLSGNCNAFTSYDYTGYLFNLPTQHWKEALPIMADCMNNCTFNDQMLNSEMKAVIQELKMYRDQYFSSLSEQMSAAIFAGHPYHHPIIGYKQDLWSVSSKDLHAFYKKHYVPNNATLVVVGDVDPEDVFSEVKKYLGKIPSNPDYEKKEHYLNQDISTKAVTLYRDIQQPMLAFSFVVPGARQKQDHLLSFIEYILGKGKSSRLYKKLIDELELATSLDVGLHDMFDYSLFFVVCEPKNIEDAEIIAQHISDEIESIIKDGITDKELMRAIKQTKMGTYRLLENIESQAYEIGKYFLATGDENYVFNFLNDPIDKIKKETYELMHQYFRPVVMHRGTILPLPEEEKEQWAKLQEESDNQDNRILTARERTLPVQPPEYANNIEIKSPSQFAFPKPKIENLSNGLKVLYATNKNTPKINLVLEFKAKYYYDPQDKQGLYSFMTNLLDEGTQKHTAQELAEIIESRGMSLSIYPGGISMAMLTEDFVFGLEILQEILTQPLFDENQIEKVRAQMLADLKSFWDEPRHFAGHLIREQIYKNHPYAKNSLGTKEALASIGKKELIEFYKKYISPDGAKIAIVGDLNDYDIKKTLELTIGKWHGPKVEELTFPKLTEIQVKEANYPINRDQVVLCMAAPSIDRKHIDFDKLNIFDQILGGGSLGSMSSRLFQLREQTGLFYTISGSLIAGSNQQPGMVLIKTIVSLDRLKEAEKAINETLTKATDTLTLQEVQEARNAIINSLVDNFASNSAIANAFLFLDKYNFPADFFDNRAKDLSKITLNDVKDAVKKILKVDSLLKLRIGRLKNDTDKTAVS